MSTNNKERIVCLDYARVFVAYLVIFGHLLPLHGTVIRPIIYAFHMPFFFLVSGILHKYVGYIQWKKYIKVLGLPFIFFNLLFLALKPICYWWGIWETTRFTGYTGFSTMLVDFLSFEFKEMISGHDAVDGPMWFVGALFWCKVFTDTILKYGKLGMGGATLVFAVFCLHHGHNMLFLRQALQAMPFFYLGFIAKDIFIHIDKLRYKPFISLILILFSVLVTKYDGPVSNYATIFGHHALYISIPLFYINAIAGSVAVLLISSCFKMNRLVNRIAISLITILGAQGLYNYTFINIFGSNCIALDFFAAFIILFACVVIHNLLNKHCPIVLGKSK